MDEKNDNTSNFSIVLLMPDIPQNTGNIGRLCYVTGSRLVLVRPFGFRLTDAQLLRAGMDYWKKLDLLILNDMAEFYDWIDKKRVFFLSSKGNQSYAQVKYETGDVFCFGSESAGFPEEIYQTAETSRLIKIPMISDARCLNVSTSTGIVLYEALRQTGKLESPVF
ncbi:MAG: tRNA (cytidine(34)-2'-O)-methyltransferase [Candidatus Riflebacteria bacterium]|nr:tRNA (cytidine(34)-2'-O)-methyltransferase [Candidatus Riflebacteria bacterium]